MQIHRSHPVSRFLASIPGIGPITATAFAATIPGPSMFRSGREFAAWLGLTPRQNSSGGTCRLGGITNKDIAIFDIPWYSEREQWSDIPKRAPPWLDHGLTDSLSAGVPWLSRLRLPTSLLASPGQ
ncbi:transposase [Mesorhizobium sp.]|uniref:transposase n=1 Tax=Mesorhizobium sp. TaxID=1871066 RepID=UPI0025811BE6|nr:transposase [Mesorhizobium sp.]